MYLYPILPILSSEINEIAYPSVTRQTTVKDELTEQSNSAGERREHYGMKVGKNEASEFLKRGGGRKGNQVSPVK